MTPRTERPHPKKVANQEAKAARLVIAIEEIAKKSKQTPLEVFGRLRTKTQWTMLLIIADPLVLAGKRKPSPPSPETELMILNRLRGRARRDA